MPLTKRRQDFVRSSRAEPAATQYQGRVFPLTPRRARNHTKRHGWSWEMPWEEPSTANLAALEQRRARRLKPISPARRTGSPNRRPPGETLQMPEHGRAKWSIPFDAPSRIGTQTKQADDDAWVGLGSDRASLGDAAAATRPASTRPPSSVQLDM